MFSPSNDSSTSEDTPPTPTATPIETQVYPEEDEEEDFQMVNIGHRWYPLDYGGST